MSRPFRLLALTAAVVTAAGVGCNRSSLVQNKQPPDPLLVSKKPVEGKPRSADPAPYGASARIDPPAPPWAVGETASPTDPDVRRPARLSSELVVRPGN